MLTSKRELFSLPRGVRYLNAAYMGPLSRASQLAAQQAATAKGRPYTIQTPDFFRESDEVRGLFASLIGLSDPMSVAIVPSVSYGVTVAATNLGARRGQRVVVVDQEFPSNVYPWRALAARDGLELVAVPPPEPGPDRAPGWNARLLEAITPATAAVAAPHVHWTDGTLFDLERIGGRCREVGAALVVDATQSVGALPFDLDRIRPDALVVAAYKWLLGPYALAFAYLGDRFATGHPLEETWLGRQGAEDFAGLVNYRDEYQPGAIRHDMGERSNFMLMPVAATAMRQILGWGVASIQAYCRSLTDPFVDAMRERGFDAEPADRRCGHLVGLRLPVRLDAGRLQARLVERRIHVSRRGEALRVAPHIYNDAADLEALVEAVSSL